jgi:hypothetical protein
MTYDEGLAQTMRDALTKVEGVTEKRMFGGLCFMLNIMRSPIGPIYRTM